MVDGMDKAQWLIQQKLDQMSFQDQQRCIAEEDARGSPAYLPNGSMQLMSLMSCDIFVMICSLQLVNKSGKRRCLNRPKRIAGKFDLKCGLQQVVTILAKFFVPSHLPFPK